MIRTKIYPKNITDFCATSFLLLCIPTVYIYELFFVLPLLYPTWTGWYNFHFIVGTFILINITSNVVATILCDTSIKGRQMLPGMERNSEWKLCTVCETTSPPRSWHCPTCNICILKRDHHCTFTSCCIGHYNMRYFLTFLTYLFIATTYGTIFNTIFIQEFVDFTSLYTLLKIVFPLAMLVVDLSTQQYYLLMYLLNVVAMVFTGVLLCYHVDHLLEGKIQHERNSKQHKYNLGRMNNVREVFGEKWYLVWIFPTIQSKLPHDGINFAIKESVKSR